MSLTEQIKEDYGTLKRFARLHGLSLKSVYMTLSGYPRVVVVRTLITLGYIESADELENKEAA